MVDRSENRALREIEVRPRKPDPMHETCWHRSDGKCCVSYRRRQPSCGARHRCPPSTFGLFLAVGWTNFRADGGVEIDAGSPPIVVGPQHRIGSSRVVRTRTLMRTDAVLKSDRLWKGGVLSRSRGSVGLTSCTALPGHHDRRPSVAPELREGPDQSGPDFAIPTGGCMPPLTLRSS